MKWCWGQTCLFDLRCSICLLFLWRVVGDGMVVDCTFWGQCNPWRAHWEVKIFPCDFYCWGCFLCVCVLCVLLKTSCKCLIICSWQLLFLEILDGLFVTAWLPSIRLGILWRRLKHMLRLESKRTTSLVFLLYVQTLVVLLHFVGTFSITESVIYIFCPFFFPFLIYTCNEC